MDERGLFVRAEFLDSEARYMSSVLLFNESHSQRKKKRKVLGPLPFIGFNLDIRSATIRYM